MTAPYIANKQMVKINRPASGNGHVNSNPATIIELDDVVICIAIPYEQCPPIIVEDCGDLPAFDPVADIRQHIADVLEADRDEGETLTFIDCSEQSRRTES